MRPAQFLLLAFILAALAKVIHSYRERSMPTSGFLFWVLIWIGTAGIVILPDFTSFVAHLLGIGRGADLIIYVSLLIIFYLIFRIYIALAHLEQEITELVRAMALEQLPKSLDARSDDGE